MLLDKPHGTCQNRDSTPHVRLHGTEPSTRLIKVTIPVVNIKQLIRRYQVGGFHDAHNSTNCLTNMFNWILGKNNSRLDYWNGRHVAMERVGRLGFTATFADRRERTISYDRISQAITPVMVVSHQIVVVKLIPYVRGSTLPARHVLAVQQETIWYVDCGRCHVRLDRRPSAVLDSQCHGLLSRSQCRSALLVRRLLRSLSDGRYGNGQVFKTASQ